MKIEFYEVGFILNIFHIFKPINIWNFIVYME